MYLGFIGTGNIESDVVSGISKSKISYKKIIVSPRNKKKAQYLKKKFKKVIIAKNNQAVIDMSDWIFLGMLPKVGENILPKLKFKNKRQSSTQHRCLVLINMLSLRLPKLILKAVRKRSRASDGVDQLQSRITFLLKQSWTILSLERLRIFRLECL